MIWNKIFRTSPKIVPVNSFDYNYYAIPYTFIFYKQPRLDMRV